MRASSRTRSAYARAMAATTEPPELAQLLGPARSHWDALLGSIGADAGMTREWKFYGAKHGWQLKLVTQKRALAYLIPREGRFTVALALSPAALDAVRASRLPAAL